MDTLILENLKELLNTEFDYNNISCCFEDIDTELIIEQMKGEGSNFDPYGFCKLYIAHYNTKDPYVYSIYVNEDDIIVYIS